MTVQADIFEIEHPAPTYEPPVETLPDSQTAPAETTDVQAAVERVRRQIAPLWPLRHFVAVNPFLGLADQDFAAAARILARCAGAKMTAPRTFYADAMQNGRITRADLAAALVESPSAPGAPGDVASLMAFALRDEPDVAFEIAPTVAHVAQNVTGQDWGRFVTESISCWAASHFDQGQAYWHSPWRHLSPYTAWRAEAVIDRTPEVSGVRGFRETVRSLPESAADAIEMALQQLDVPTTAGLDAYLHRLLLTIGGWAGYARYQLWNAELHGNSDTTLDELLAIRLAWEVALLNAFDNAGLREAWTLRKYELTSSALGAGAEATLAGDLLLHAAFEKAYQRELIAQVSAAQDTLTPARPDVQAVFCIDVRSEVFRRALESVDAAAETIGFAGFFGFPIEYVPLGAERGGAQCPVLLTPQFVVTQSVRDATDAEEKAARHKRNLRRRVAKAWRSFKFAAVACFGFVGPVGLAYIKKLITDSLGKSRPVEHPASYGLDKEVSARLGPRLEPREVAGRMTGMAPQQRLDVAEGVLRAMSLTDNFARLVLLVGHGSTTVNNPHATGLDCGACGGHTGEANARVAAQVLNDPGVRAGLQERGIAIPTDTRFLACQHDTTTDQVVIFDRDQIPTSHAADLARIEVHLAEAGRIARAERARVLHVAQEDNVDAAVIARSRDWSQVRPEWGLAGCAAFIVAPRGRTRGLDLGGRAFLHSYDWQEDADFSVLELIMTAPMIVANWINLQYFGSTVDNRIFGSGNKVLHNVVGTLGVLEGNGGDLRVGLPWQSLHDGETYIHEPLRLNVLIEAPIAAMNDILARHAAVRQLLDNGWLHLFALDASGTVSHQYAGDLTWTPLAADSNTRQSLQEAVAG